MGKKAAFDASGHRQKLSPAACAIVQDAHAVFQWQGLDRCLAGGILQLDQARAIGLRLRDRACALSHSQRGVAGGMWLGCDALLCQQINRFSAVCFLQIAAQDHRRALFKTRFDRVKISAQSLT